MIILIAFSYMPTLERLKAVGGAGGGGGGGDLKFFFSEGRKMVHSVAFWIKSVQLNL